MSLTRKTAFSSLLILTVTATGCSIFQGQSASQGKTAKLASWRGTLSCDAPQNSEQMAREVIKLVNKERSRQGLSPVKLNSKLNKMAGDFACRMSTGNFLSHQDPETGDGPMERVMAVNYEFSSLGETLGMGQQTPKEVVKFWVNSSVHNRIMLSPIWREAGIAVRGNEQQGLYWVQVLADPGR